MAKDPSIMAWLLRIEETEGLLKSRQAELVNRTSVNQTLRQELEQNNARKAVLDEELLEVEAEQARLKINIMQARHKVHEEHQEPNLEEVLRLRSRLRALQDRMKHLEALCSKESTSMIEFQSFMEQHVQGLSSSEELDRKLAKVEAMLAAQQHKQDEQQQLEVQLAEFEQEVQGQQQQKASLQTSLQAAIEANISLSEKMKDERQQHEHQMRELQQQLVKAKAQVLSLKRHQASKESRLWALRQEAAQLQGVGRQLDTSLQHAREHLNMIAAQYAMDDEW